MGVPGEPGREKIPLHTFRHATAVVVLVASPHSQQLALALILNMDRGRRAMPVQNKACHERHVKKCQDNHRLRLAKMKPTIDCHAPSSMRKVAAKTNAKKQQIMVSKPLCRNRNCV